MIFFVKTSLNVCNAFAVNSSVVSVTAEVSASFIVEVTTSDNTRLWSSAEGQVKIKRKISATNEIRNPTRHP